MIENSTYTWYLMWALGQHPFPPPSTSHIIWFHPPKQSTRKKHIIQKKINSKQIVSYCLGLRTQKPWLREEDLETSPKRGGDKINMLRQGKNTALENKFYRAAWTQIWEPSILKCRPGTYTKNRQYRIRR